MNNLPRENLVSAAYTDLFILMPALKASKNFGKATESFNEKLAQWINEKAESLATDISEDDIENSKFAIAAFIDENVMTSSWPLRYRWSLLQSKYFGTALAGSEFYEKLAKISKSDVRDIYHLCTMLGFKGKFMRDVDAHQKYIASIREEISEPSVRLSPNLAPKKFSMVALGKAKWWVWVSLGVYLIAIVAILLVFQVWG